MPRSVGTRRRCGRAALCLVAVAASSRAVAQDIDPADLPSLAFDSVHQIQPTSPVSGGNDPNSSDDVLYILEEEEEDAAEIIENERGIIRQNGRPAGQRNGRRTHFFVNPSARVAGKLALSKRVSVEVFLLGGSGVFRDNVLSFGARATNLSGGVSANADFGLFNGVVAFEHRDAFGNVYGPWKSTGDKVGMTVNKTFPFFVRGLTLTPQLIAARDIVNPMHGSAATLESTVGLTYDLNPKISMAASAGYGAVFLYGFPGFRHDEGLKALVGVTVKPLDGLAATLGASTNKTSLYGRPRYQADGSLSPNLNVKYTVLPAMTVSLAASYVRVLSTATGSSTFKYNLNPSVNLTIPL